MTITHDDLLEIHEILVDWFAASEDPVAPPGVRDHDLLFSSAGRPYQTVERVDAYPTIFNKDAALFHSLINNHPFHNGNKRSALISAQVILAQENYWLDHSSDEEMFDFTRRAASHELTDQRADELPYILEWFEANSRKILKGEHPMKFGELKSALARFDFELDPPIGEFVDILKDGRRIERIIKQGIQGFRPYHTDYIAGLRRRLKLTPADGIDSARFYGHKGVASTASQFIELRAHPGSLESGTWLWPGEPAEHEADYGEADEGDRDPGVTLEVANEATIAA
ncbi:MAG: Fic family protein, partial [Alphaproteobacteria bacterium]|nr:Fic family protein [Alphaproteobacteria bacterium]